MNSSQKKEEPLFLWTTHEHSREEADRELDSRRDSSEELGPYAGGGGQQRWCNEPQASLVLGECSGPEVCEKRLGNATSLHRQTGLLWTVAQLGLLFLIPTLFTEVRGKGCNLSTGWNHSLSHGLCYRCWWGQNSHELNLGPLGMLKTLWWVPSLWVLQIWMTSLLGRI